jgi:hypothetical protein
MNVGDFLLMCLVLSILTVVSLAFLELWKWLSVEADRRGVPEKFGQGLVIRHEFLPAHSTYAGKAYIHHEDSFYLVVRLGTHEEKIMVLKSVYEGISDRHWVPVTFQVGRHTGKTYLCDFIGRIRS